MSIPAVLSPRTWLVVPEKAFKRLIYLILFREFIWPNHQKRLLTPQTLVNYDSEDDETSGQKKFVSIPLGANYKLHAHVGSVTDEIDWGVFVGEMESSRLLTLVICIN